MNRTDQQARRATYEGEAADRPEPDSSSFPPSRPESRLEPKWLRTIHICCFCCFRHIQYLSQSHACEFKGMWHRSRTNTKDAGKS
jgi:hypothetical protein